MKYLSNNVAALTAVMAIVATPAMAAVDAGVTDAITSGFADAKIVAVAVLVGLAGLFGIMLAKRLLR